MIASSSDMVPDQKTTLGFGIIFSSMPQPSQAHSKVSESTTAIALLYTLESGC